MEAGTSINPQSLPRCYGFTFLWDACWGRVRINETITEGEFRNGSLVGVGYQIDPATGKFVSDTRQSQQSDYIRAQEIARLRKAAEEAEQKQDELEAKLRASKQQVVDHAKQKQATDTELAQLRPEAQPGIRNPRMRVMSLLSMLPECAVGQHTGCIAQIGDVIGPIKNGRFDGVAIGHSQSGYPINAGIYEDGKFLRFISLSDVPASLQVTSIAKAPVQLNVNTSTKKWPGPLPLIGSQQLIFSNGDVYFGEFDKGRRTGRGTYTFNDGSKYIGEFLDGEFQGKGIEFDVNGTIERSGIYEAGRLVRSQVIDPATFARVQQQPNSQTADTKANDNKPRWNNGQLMTTDAAEATAKVPIPQAVKPVTELEQLQAEAQQARLEKVELEAQLAAAQQKTQVQPTALIGPRLSVHAIVIGNGAYQGSGRLDNPINDARAMSAKLRQMGFKVTTIENATRSKLVRALVGFNRSASATDVSMFFYAGHAAQISGINYMLPTDINMNDLSEVPLHGISLNSVIDQYLPGKTKLVFLDACRDNPLLQVASRSMTRGLAPISVSEGVMIAYATKDGSVAADGNGKNSPFTKALLQHIDGPDDISVVLRKVRAEVMQDTDGKQQPWDYNSLTGGSLILSAIRAK